MTVPYLRLVPLPKKGVYKEPVDTYKTTLFRGKIIHTNPEERKWVYGDLSNTKMVDDDIVSSDDTYIAVQNDPSSDVLISLHRVIPETVGQYINRADNNGTPIFEDDIVEITIQKSLYPEKDESVQCLYFVNWEDDKYWFMPFTSDGSEPGDDEWLNISCRLPIVIVGNTQDNPELLPPK